MAVEESLKAHKYANLFPMMDDEALERLSWDITENGQLESILTYNGLVLDGRNRLAACELAEVEPRFTEYKGKDPLGVVISANLTRRHMTTYQRAMLGVDLKKEYAALNKPGPKDPANNSHISGNSRDLAAAAVGVSHAYITMAEKIKEDAPELVDLVLKGSLPLQQAYEIAKTPLESQRERITSRVTTERANVNQTKGIVREETGQANIPAAVVSHNTSEDPALVVDSGYVDILNNMEHVDTIELHTKWLAWNKKAAAYHKERIEEDGRDNN
jgi:ParB-like chromosome segregation protein Spo0J